MIQESLGVVIQSFNQPEVTARCVRSALNFIKPSQILLFHNGSQNSAIAILKEQFPDIQHEVSELNLGFAAGANLALLKATKKWKWMLFLAGDTEVLSLVDPSNFSSGLYAPIIWHRIQQSIESWGGALHLPSANLRTLKTYKEMLSQYEKFYVPGTAFIIDAQTFLSSNGFDVKLGGYWEDVDFSLRLANEGVTVFPCQGIEILHAGGKSIHKDPHYNLYPFQRNRWIVTKRFLPRDMKITFYYSWIEELVRISSRLKNQRRYEDRKRFRKAFWDGIRSALPH